MYRDHRLSESGPGHEMFEELMTQEMLSFVDELDEGTVGGLEAIDPVCLQRSMVSGRKTT